MKRYFLCLLALSFLLSGCSLFDGSYAFVTPHQDQSGQAETEVVSVRNYRELREALVELVHSGTEGSIINAPNYDTDRLARDMETAISYVRGIDAIGAYAVEDIHYEMGTNSLTTAMAVKISYIHGREELQQVRTAEDMAQAREIIGTALQRCEAGIVMLVQKYEEEDFIQLVEDFAKENPDAVMETPEVKLEVYPESGQTRVVSIKFIYQNSRTDLRQMQQQVAPIFSSATLYVSGSGSDFQKLSQLYAFLMERFDAFQIKTSITPSYSLLHHGVGDSHAFAQVYSRMCLQAGLECYIVTGTRQGEPWSWNIVCDDGYYYHVDLLWCSENGGFRLRTDARMSDYVWDYSAYPACIGAPVEVVTGQETEAAEQTVPATEAAEETIPEETEADEEIISE